MRDIPISEKLASLQSGEAIHVGHSYLILNIAGIRIALDPATENGYCAAPFSNFTSTAYTQLSFLKPLVNPQEVVPTASELAKHIDFVVYSHLHTDHFNAALLAKMIRANPQIRVVWPTHALASLQFRPKGVSRKLPEVISKFPIIKNYISGIQEFLTVAAPTEISSKNTFELSPGERRVLQENPLIEICAFEVRHPKAQLYIRLPYEPVNLPPVLGYKVSYQEGDKQKSVLLVGESATDPELLWQIWKNRQQLAAIFIPIADESTTRGLKWLKDAYHHASLQLIALSERLSGSQTLIHCLHQGLWYYTIDQARIEAGRRMIEHQPELPLSSSSEVEQQLRSSHKLRKFSFKSILAQISLIRTVSRYPLESLDKVRLHPVGKVLRFAQSSG